MTDSLPPTQIPTIDPAILKRIPLFSYMPDEAIIGIRSIMDQIEYAPGTAILQQGEQGELFFVVVAGHVQFVVLDARGQPIVVDEVGPGGYFGELSMLTGEARSARVVAVDRVITLALDRAEFFAFLQQHPAAALEVLKTLGHRLHRVDALLRSSVSRNVNAIADEHLTVGQRIADRFAATMGSWPFIIIQSIFLVIWVALNVVAWGRSWDPYPFILLNLVLSFQAAYSAPIIMMSQNRQSDKDRLTADIDHQVNTKAEFEIGLLLQRIEHIDRRLRTASRDQPSTDPQP
ncbi:MAG: hypothetical protein NVS4B8_04330 [Herpetosiphon sp.]